MRRCHIQHGRDLNYTDTRNHNSRTHMVKCFFDEMDSTRPPTEVGEPADQEGEGIKDAFNRGLAYLSNKFPSNSDGLARPVMPGEHHAILKLKSGVGRANFCGPGTRLDVRLKPPKAVPRTEVDKICEKHDIDYLFSKNSSDVRRADQKMIRNLDKAKDARINVLTSKLPIQAKMKAEDYGVLSKTKFISDKPVDSATLSRARRRRKELEQEGLGEMSPAEMLLKSLKKKKRKSRKKKKALWSEVAPKTRAQRKKVFHKCGDQCFAGPNLSYPICPYNTQDCEPDERGVSAARSRAKQFDHRRGAVGKRARKALKKTTRLS